jgi:hypothetical protein
MKKKLHQSLTVQSAVCVAALILAKVLLPVFTKYEVPDPVFESLCAVLGVSITIGLRRALPIFIIALLPIGLIHCGPSICQKATIEITAHPSKPSPAGTVTVRCDGAEKSVVVADEVRK